MTFEKVRKIIADQLSINEDKIVETTVLGEDLGADSLDMVEVLMSLEDEFGVSIPDEEIPNIKTVKDLVEFIDNNK